MHTKQPHKCSQRWKLNYAYDNMKSHNNPICKKCSDIFMKIVTSIWLLPLSSNFSIIHDPKVHGNQFEQPLSIPNVNFHWGRWIGLGCMSIHASLQFKISSRKTLVEHYQENDINLNTNNQLCWISSLLIACQEIVLWGHTKLRPTNI